MKIEWFKIFPLLVATITILSGISVLIGWKFNLPTMAGLFSFWLPMKPNAAICFVLLGFGIILSNYVSLNVKPIIRKCSFYVGQSLIIWVFLFNFLILGEYVFHFNLGIDELFFQDSVVNFFSKNPIKNKLEIAFPGRIKLEASFCFELLSFALLDSRSNYRRIISSSLGVFVLAIALASLSTYLTPELEQFGWFGYGIMRMNAAVLFMLLGITTIVITWQQNVLSWSLNKYITSTFIFSLSLLVVIGFNISRTQFWLQSINYEIEQNEQIENKLKHISITISAAQTNTRGYLLTGETKFLDTYFSLKESVLNQIHDLPNFSFYADDANFQQNCAQINTMVEQQLAWYESMMTLRKNEKSIPKEKIFHGTDLLEQFYRFVDKIEADYENRIAHLKDSLNTVPSVLYSLICLGTLLSILFLFTAIFVLNIIECRRKKALEEINRMAFYDPLTQLPNRRLLYDRLQQDITICHRQKNGCIAVLMMDLDRFKNVNDTLGHAAGDDLLKQVAIRVVTDLRDSDVVARLGGDEFVIVLINLFEKADVTRVALKIINDLQQPFLLSGSSVFIGASIGISFYPEHGQTVDELISHADSALYQVKKEGKGNFAYFSFKN